MTLEEFAKTAGVTIIRCDPEWGGTYGYKVPDAPNCSFCGYKTEKDAYQKWAIDTFGESAFKAMKKLFRTTAKKAI